MPNQNKLPRLAAALLLAGAAACTSKADRTADTAAPVTATDSAAAARTDTARGALAPTDSANTATGGGT